MEPSLSIDLNSLERILAFPGGLGTMSADSRELAGPKEEKERKNKDLNL